MRTKIFIVYIIRVNNTMQFLGHNIMKDSNQTTQKSNSNDFHWIVQPDKSSNTRGLAIGNYKFAQNLDCLHQHNIGAVVSVFGEAQLKLSESINHFRILVGDDPSENIKCFFDSSHKFIVQNLKNTNVLVHCKAGVSRSSTIVIAYLLKSKKMTVNQALAMLRAKREIVEPNKGFMKQLRLYERQLRQQRQKEICMIY